MLFKSINPVNGKEAGQYPAISSAELITRLDRSGTAFQDWRQVPLSERCHLMRNAGAVLRDNGEEYARMITLEMGKPITESRAEIAKCAWVCDYYADHASEFLVNEEIRTDATRSFVRYDPLGAILAIMPWNFPFWQVFRFAAPTLTAGNTGLLKHAPNVFGCAALIEGVFDRAGFPEGVFQSLIVHHDQTERIIAHQAVRAVTLTGSEQAGSAVGALAGKYLRKSVLELGGNNAFIVLEDADLDQAVQTAVVARMLNGGQSCIAAKRFILVDRIYDAFVSQFKEAVRQLRTGDPFHDTTQIGPLARKDLADRLHQQVQQSISHGAELLLGGGHHGCFHEPTILGNVTPNMPAFREETFGPLAAMIRAENEEEAYALAERSRFGLGVTVCTTDVDKAIALAAQISDGAYFINELVKSDPRLPFGGTKHSGYGRELARDGIMEFVNRKTVYVR